MRDLSIEEYREYNLLADDQKEARAREMFLEMMEISNSMQPQTAADFQNSPIKQALESLRVNGKPLFDEENPVSLENYTVRIREAMDRIAPAMENPSAIKVPYCQAPDGSCQAIKPGTDMTPVTAPRRPAWYKRWFKGIVPSWRKEVTDYEKTVRHIEDQQTIPSYQDVLEERAEKRTLQSAVLNSRGAIKQVLRRDIHAVLWPGLRLSLDCLSSRSWFYKYRKRKCSVRVCAGTGDGGSGKEL